MYISSLSIRNYRNFRNSKLVFNKGINSVIGENGSGKSNAFHALRLMIDDSLPRVTKFYENDFNRKLGSWFGHWIIISIEFSELDTAEEIQALSNHSTGIMDGSATGRYTLYFRPKFDFRKKLFEYSQTEDKNQEEFKSLLCTINIDDYEAVYMGRSTVDFENDKDYKCYVGDFEKIVFPDPDDRRDDVFGVKLPNGIYMPSEVSCTYVKALRDVESDLRSFHKNPLVNLLRGQEKTVKIEDQDAILKNIDELNAKISNLKEVKNINIGVEKSIEEAVGSTYSPNIEIKSELPNEMDKLFQSLNLWVGDPDQEGYKGKLWELSLGGANLIYLSLKLLEYERVKSGDRAANFLLIEEPEAHIHTHIQKTLFNNLPKNKTQVIISTHSTHISSVSKIGSMNILSRGEKESVVFNPSNGLNSDEIQRLERYLDAMRSNLLFAKGVLLVEGDAELILIPAMFKKVFGITLDEIGISVVNICSTGFENVAMIFDRKRIQRPCAIITDSDKSILPLSEDAGTDSEEEKACRNSQLAGINRKGRLGQISKDNPYICPFYADHTFEVDFVLNSNEYEIKNVIGDIYVDSAAKTEACNKIDNGDIAIKGKEVLRLAKKTGKGWFAILVEGQLCYNTFIPDYILKAIAFASPHIRRNTLKTMAEYRLRNISQNEKEACRKQAQKLLDGKGTGRANVEKILDEYEKILPIDQLTKFMSYL
ncbi:MAG: AAA family ATPase [Phycisphaerae bacterium]|jgi:predicted ATP-dependent endonuclease of OLD family